VYFAMKHKTLLHGLIAALLVTASGPAFAESAYIAQVNSKISGPVPSIVSQPVPVSPATPYAPRQMSFVPTPETAAPARNGNYAQTIQVGNSNAVFQAQTGGNNISNVGVWGGKNNDVGVFQGGQDLSNVNLINTQGLSVAVLQPPGSAPMNVLIARLPNGGLLIKK
jgi:hypothetical protein